jgi:hypothetical protein
VDHSVPSAILGSTALFSILLRRGGAPIPLSEVGVEASYIAIWSEAGGKLVILPFGQRGGQAQAAAGNCSGEVLQICSSFGT